MQKNHMKTIYKKSRQQNRENGRTLELIGLVDCRLLSYIGTVQLVQQVKSLN